ncbi:TPR-like protein [Basidiobolus meristosporus CBS 931.73]|uniref:TPR-like protein n=1 Tax=Basidiobolus meristosporus CBS 931.73 TaxID=1314790 RepID=A0A1Y1YKW0_9FUNG|nr:TPR-like protein [Basidiobolus meristosporus CBS 931.73]|eukprot:ORX98234.1 TPR-like protein [Basidiobolus meristosporus CBS 931.73]
MTSLKANLKLAKEAITKKDFENALVYSERALEWDQENYNAWIFLGLANQNLDKHGESEKAYKTAIELNHSQLLGWQGLSSLYEKMENWEVLIPVLEETRILCLESNPVKALEITRKIIELCKKTGKPSQMADTWKSFIPGSPYYEQFKSLEDVPTPKQALLEIIKIQEEDDASTIKREVEVRRRRLGADSLSVIIEKVHSEVLSKSELASAYEQLLQLLEADSADTEEIRIKYLKHLHQKLQFTLENKNRVMPYYQCEFVISIIFNEQYGLQLREQLVQQARLLINQGTNDELPYQILIESFDVGSPDDYDISFLTTYVEKFQDSELANLVQGHLKWKVEGDQKEALYYYSIGFETQSSSIFGHHSLSWFQYTSREFDSALDYAVQGKRLVQDYMAKTGAVLNSVLTSLELCEARCYLNMGLKNVPAAYGILSRVLESHPGNIVALEGMSIALCMQKKYEKALQLMQQVIESDPENHFALSEIGWIYYNMNEYAQAIENLRNAVALASNVALYYYRLAVTYWSMDGEYRSNREFCYANLIQAAKISPEFAQVFVYLGHYYRLVEHDDLRAKKCYQKAFSLDSAEAEAALHLSTYYINNNEKDKAESVFRALSETNTRCGWAWKKLGFVEMITPTNHEFLKSKENYIDAIGCFQIALRTDVKNYACWEGLAESYVLEGRYMAALKAFKRASELDPTATYPYLQIAFINQKIGLYSEAITQYEKTLGEILQSDDASNKKHFELPFLKGLADCYLAQAKEYFQNGLYGRVAESCQNGLLRAKDGLLILPNSVSLWKIIGDICVLLKSVPTYLGLCPPDNLLEITRAGLSSPDNSPQLIHEVLKNIQHQLDIYQGHQEFTTQEHLRVLLLCASVAYRATIIYQNYSHASSWYDLGLVYYFSSQSLRQDSLLTDADASLGISINCFKTSLHIEPSHHQSWNALGICTLKLNPKISQHSFIKAMEYDTKSALPWSNLGYLYLLQSDLELANQAFLAAQSLDPDWINAWLGQAFIAESNSQESFNLFQHAFDISLASAPDANYCFAVSAFKKIADFASQPQSVLDNAAFALQKYTEQCNTDPSAYNLLGLLLERQQRYEQAALAFDKSYHILKSIHDSKTTSQDLPTLNNQISIALTNKARVLCPLGLFEESTLCYLTAQTIDHSNKNRTVYNYIGLGIAYYFNGQLEDSLKSFEVALVEAQDDPELAQDVTLFLSHVLWALGTEQHQLLAKDLLFKCHEEHPQFMPVLYSLCAMGLVQGDGQLSEAALNEMVKCDIETDDKQEALSNIEFLFSRAAYLQGDLTKARQFLAKSIHQYPYRPELWSRLSAQLIYVDPGQSAAAQASANAAIAVESVYSSLSTEAMASCYDLCSLSTLGSGSGTTKAAYTAAQKAVMLAPWVWKSWSTLESSMLASMIHRYEEQSCLEMAEYEFIILEEILVFLRQTYSISSANYIRTPTQQIAPTEEVFQTWIELLRAYLYLFRAHVSGSDNPELKSQCLAIAYQIPEGMLEYLTADDTATSVLQTLVYQQLGRCLLENDDLANAITAFKNCLQIDANSVEAIKELANLFAKRSYTDATELCYRYILSHHSESLTPEQIIGDCLRLGHYALEHDLNQVAFEALNEANRQDPSHDLVKLLQAIVFWRSGNLNRAIRVLSGVTEKWLAAEMNETLREQIPPYLNYYMSLMYKEKGNAEMADRYMALEEAVRQ